MNVQNNLQGMQQLFSSQEVTKAENARPGAAAQATTGSSTDQATLSSAASVAAQTSPDADVRMEKVAEVHQALGQGTYSVPSSEVAGKMIDQMLGK
ncbi:MAG TPA: flagellar biosynthesis anti-sigma factor FlgM [Acidobacteriaceae bacterium]|jgi:flagellar biosynthesis anti-sigma factor FlgM|nr:flagellar biosynthesis anti-sigma factor FlgM [Acidobacteriaceae bacterium]